LFRRDEGDHLPSTAVDWRGVCARVDTLSAHELPVDLGLSRLDHVPPELLAPHHHQIGDGKRLGGGLREREPLRLL
jgi:hypothetical protein